MNMSLEKETIAVLFGGANSEHEVSRRTSILGHISREKYNVLMIGITKDGRWLNYQGPIEKIPDGSWEKSNAVYPAIISPDASHHGMIILKDNKNEFVKIDVVFPVLHGKNGEDGTIQGLFEIAGIPYVGCGVGASSNCMDKEYTHIILESAGIKTAKWSVVKKQDLADFDAAEKNISAHLGYPMFVKPANAGSSVGVNKAKNKAQLKNAIELALVHDKKVIVEEFINGTEIECAVMGNDNPIAPVVGELEIRAEFYDYEAKYINDSTIIHVPARIDEKSASKIKAIAINAYKALGCTGLARVDFFLCENKDIILLEPNTLPGFTSISMYPKMMMESGMTYAEIIENLISLAKERN
ncbi:MAG: D-alanine--D-alanine ligase family protein [Oscillospiraceae bacterium]